MVEYITIERGVDLEVAKRYCREVHYKIGDRSFYAVGFQSDAGGWEFSASKGFKLSSSPKSPTTIKCNSNSTLLFEGFIDMLSYITFAKCVIPTDNIVVLNSVVNLPKVAEFLKSQQSIFV